MLFRVPVRLLYRRPTAPSSQVFDRPRLRLRGYQGSGCRRGATASQARPASMPSARARGSPRAIPAATWPAIRLPVASVNRRTCVPFGPWWLELPSAGCDQRSNDRARLIARGLRRGEHVRGQVLWLAGRPGRAGCPARKFSILSDHTRLLGLSGVQIGPVRTRRVPARMPCS